MGNIRVPNRRIRLRTINRIMKKEKLSKGASEIVDIIFGDEEEIVFEFEGKNGKKIITSNFNEPQKRHYKNDLIRLKTTSEKSESIDILMTPYEALLIANGLNQAVLFHEKSNKRFLK